MIRAYDLVQAAVGSSAEVGHAVSRVAGIVSADVVTDPYDVIAVAEAASIDALGKPLVSNIQPIDGATRTLSRTRRPTGWSVGLHACRGRTRSVAPTPTRTRLMGW
jgi:hypothetical protein